MNDTSIKPIIEKRKSIRNYTKDPLTESDFNRVKELIGDISKEPSVFSAPFRIHLLDAKEGVDTERLSTYGVIKGAKTFLCITALKEEEGVMESIGYQFERIVLTLTSWGIGTCWLAGTFNREQFASSFDMKENEFFPILCPVGYPSDKGSLKNTLLRALAKSDQRKKWEKIFFDGDFKTPLTKEKAGEYAFALEMLRLAPSAVNKQPWRILKKDGYFHFFAAMDPQNSHSFPLPRLDVGIATSHFHLALLEKGLKGEFVRLEGLAIEAPEDAQYLYSWKCEEE